MRRHFPVLVIALVLASCGPPGADPAASSSASIARDPIALPEPDTAAGIPLDTALARRRSVRSLTDALLSLAEVGHLLWAAQGVTAEWGGRTAPSAGARYPLELAVAVDRVEGLEPGVYRYVPGAHALTQVTHGVMNEDLAESSLDQRVVADAAAVVIVAADYERTTGKYGARGRRYVQMEAGHAAQNLLLEATATELGAVPVGAFDDEQVGAIASLSSDEVPLYVIPIGRPSPD